MTDKISNKKSHLTEPERFLIEKMLRVGSTISLIAKTLGRGVSTVSEEVSRNKNNRRDSRGAHSTYRSKTAHKRATQLLEGKKKTSNKVLSHKQLKTFVEYRLKKGVSPEAIAKILKKQSVLPYASGKSIRKYLHLKLKQNKS